MNKAGRSILIATTLGLAAPVAADISTLAFLTGCWDALGKEPGSGEHWTRPAGKSMLGLSRTVRDGVTVTYEFLRIVEDHAGGIALIAAPAGQPTARFEMVSLTAGEVIFENPRHDFPQRIIYRLADDGTLLGRIEGEDDGRTRSADFPLKRAACELA